MTFAVGTINVLETTYKIFSRRMDVQVGKKETERRKSILPYLLRKDLDQPQKRFRLHHQPIRSLPYRSSEDAKKGKVQSRLEKGHEVSAFSLARQSGNMKPLLLVKPKRRSCGEKRKEELGSITSGILLVVVSSRDIE